jgi:hypothetical protein
MPVAACREPEGPCPSLLQDGVLSDEELNAFQVLCFNQPLQREELQMLKDVGAAAWWPVRAD